MYKQLLDISKSLPYHNRFSDFRPVPETFIGWLSNAHYDHPIKLYFMINTTSFLNKIDIASRIKYSLEREKLILKSSRLGYNAGKFHISKGVIFPKLVRLLRGVQSQKTSICEVLQIGHRSANALEDSPHIMPKLIAECVTTQSLSYIYTLCTTVRFYSV